MCTKFIYIKKKELDKLDKSFHISELHKNKSFILKFWNLYLSKCIVNSLYLGKILLNVFIIKY